MNLIKKLKIINRGLKVLAILICLLLITKYHQPTSSANQPLNLSTTTSINYPQSNSIADRDINIANQEYIYTGLPITPQISIDGLIENLDYLVSYDNNINVGNGTITIFGIGFYHGVITKTFVIIPQTITSDQINPIDQYIYNGGPIEPTVTIETIVPIVPIVSLILNQDYLVEYTNNINSGIGLITVKGINNYQGEVTIEFIILPMLITDQLIPNLTDIYRYNGNPQTPTIPGFIEGIDVELSYQNNVNAGEGMVYIKGINNYYGEVIKTFTIRKAPYPIDDLKIEITKITKTSITIKPIDNAQYSIDQGVTWQDEPYFDDLHKDTQYQIMVRIKATDNYLLSEVVSIKVITSQGILGSHQGKVLASSAGLTLMSLLVIGYWIYKKKTKF